MSIPFKKKVISSPLGFYPYKQRLCKLFLATSLPTTDSNDNLLFLRFNFDAFQIIPHFHFENHIMKNDLLPIIYK